MKKENDIILEKANQSVLIVCSKERDNNEIKLGYFINNNHKAENGKNLKVNPEIDFLNYELFYSNRNDELLVYGRKDIILVLEISLRRAVPSFFLSGSQNILYITIYDSSKESYFTIGLDPSNNKNNKTPSKNLTLLKSNEKSKYYCLNQFNNEETKLLLEL